MVLVCNCPEGADEVLEHLGTFSDPAGQMRLARLHGRSATDWATLHGSADWQRAVAAVGSYDEAPLLDMDM
jgi:beta-N-acetylhexosaminidase